jgi:hypothetical protein
MLAPSRETTYRTYFMNQILRMTFISTLVPALFLGCASITTGSSQKVSIQTSMGTWMLAGASCTLSNSKGSWTVTSPGTISVPRAYGDMNVVCEKPGISTGVTAIKSNMAVPTAGNALIGGIVGFGLDVGTGAAFKYPSKITVQMGTTTYITNSPTAPDGYDPVPIANRGENF